MDNSDGMIVDVAVELRKQVRGEEWQRGRQGGHFPSVNALNEAMKLISQVIFPEYLIESLGELTTHRIVINLERIHEIMAEQIGRTVERDSEAITGRFIASLTEIKALLTTDVEAIYKADPAASSYAEIVLCYPTILAMTHHRVAHSLHTLGVPIIPRIIAEQAHQKSGIDIHPGATIGSHFAIDHGTGVVIGETTIIGRNVVIYQGVTLGAKGFRFDENGNAINVPRHPIIEDDVRIYSNSSILGRVTIGRGSVIGGNMWIDKDIEPNTTVIKSR